MIVRERGGSDSLGRLLSVMNSYDSEIRLAEYTRTSMTILIRMPDHRSSSSAPEMFLADCNSDMYIIMSESVGYGNFRPLSSSLMWMDYAPMMLHRDQDVTSTA